MWYNDAWQHRSDDQLALWADFFAAEQIGALAEAGALVVTCAAETALGADFSSDLYIDSYTVDTSILSFYLLSIVTTLL